MGSWAVTTDGGELKRLEARLALMGRSDLRKKMRRNIRTASGPVIADLRGAVMSSGFTSSKGGKARPDTSTRLRSRIAGALTVSTTTRGVRIRVPAKKVGEYGRTLPKYLDAELTAYRVLRHPVFGRRENEWVEQRGRPWFFVTIRKHQPAFRRAILAAMDEAGRGLTR